MFVGIPHFSLRGKCERSRSLCRAHPPLIEVPYICCVLSYFQNIHILTMKGWLDTRMLYCKFMKYYMENYIVVG